MSEISGVSVEELQKIEAGEDAPLAKLRDIALCLGTSVMGVLGNGYFQTQVTDMDFFVKDDSGTIRSPGGFWGHLGVLLRGQPKYMWFPITHFTRRMILQNNVENYMAIPCMDNSLLLVNCKMVEELTLLDEACDQPADMDWNYKVSCGEIPNVVYEAFDDYMLYKENQTDVSEYDLSEKFIKALDHFVDENKIDIEKFAAELNTMTVMFSSGRIQEHDLQNDDSDELAATVCQIYETGELLGNEMIMIEDINGAEILVNFKNIAMVKLPLAKMESKIHESFEEIENDCRE